MIIIDILVAVLVLAIMMMLFFFGGAAMAIRMIREADEMAEYKHRRMEAYRAAGVEKPGDPLPYVAPPVRRRRRGIPCMAELDRRLRSGRRGTVKITGEEDAEC